MEFELTMSDILSKMLDDTKFAKSVEDYVTNWETAINSNDKELTAESFATADKILITICEDLGYGVLSNEHEKDTRNLLIDTEERDLNNITTTMLNIIQESKEAKNRIAKLCYDAWEWYSEDTGGAKND